MPQQDAAESQPDELPPDANQPDGVPVEPAAPQREPDGEPAVGVKTDLTLIEETSIDAVETGVIAAEEVSMEAVINDMTTADVETAEVVEIDVVASGETLPDENPPAAAEPVEPPPPVKESRRLSRAERETIDRQQRRFSACGRCSYFIADCKVYLGEEGLQTAMLAVRDGWLRLEGDRTFDRLIMNSYGLDLGADYDSLDATCPECRRRFVVVNLPDSPTRLKIQV